MPPLRKPNDFWGDRQQVLARLFRESDERLKKRLNAVLLLMEGQSQKDVAKEAGVCVATVRNWTKRWNDAGIAGLRPRHIGTDFFSAYFRRGMAERGFQQVNMSDKYAAWAPCEAGPLEMIETHRDKIDEYMKQPKIFRR